MLHFAKRHILLLVLLLAVLRAGAQEFVNLTAEQVRVGESLPVFSHEFPLGKATGGVASLASDALAGSAYTVSIEYPEFIDMSADEVGRLHAITTDTLPALPQIEQYIGVSRRQATLYVSFIPIVFRDGKYQKLVSFKLKAEPSPSRPVALGRGAHAPSADKPQQGKYSPLAQGVARSETAASPYASHSVLATGRWAVISVPATGVYQLTDALVRQCGFTHLNHVRVYGYGGALQPEVLTADYLKHTDDLHEVPTCTVGGRRLFHAVGPVSWQSAADKQRTRNPYSNVGCYFLTESTDAEPLTADSAAFVSSFYPAPDDYHSLYEVDDFAWYHSGRNLYESTPLPTEGYRSYELAAHHTDGELTVAMTYQAPGTVSVVVNDSVMGTINLTQTLSSYVKAAARSQTFSLKGMLRPVNTVQLRQTSGEGTMRLDYLALTMPMAAPAPNLSTAAFPVPTYEYGITNQDLHADGPADMVIVIPTSQKLRSQAERLKQLHEERDSLRVRIVPADELYNEFSSGTPDANAYRRYLKMLYDRAETEADMPRYLLLFGDGTWDNRMATADWRRFSPSDFLLCYESENSLSETDSYVSDDYFCLLDDGEGASLTRSDKTDVGVGRLTARTEAEAKILVDKIVDYANNVYAGDWQNTLCFMGDDGNNNVHMSEAEAAVNTVLAQHPSFSIRKVYWDAYERIVASTGFRYPDVMRMVKQQMQTGALIMDYCGHGRADQISHERVLGIEDFAMQTSLRLPLWVTASCDIMPFDSQLDNIGETAMLNTRGGAIAFFGTTRTVYTGDNQNMNCAFLKHVLGTTDGRRNTLGDAVRLAKNEVRALPTYSKDGGRSDTYVINKLHYSLLGDPALTLAAPTRSVVIDSINGRPVSQDTVRLVAGQQATVSGHVEGGSFNGVAALTVKDVETKVVCRLNNTGSDGAQKAYSYLDRPTTVYNGQDSLRNGRFNLTFVVPQDISYSDATGQMTIYALSADRQQAAHGRSENFTMGSGDTPNSNDGIGPSIYCYLNTSDFTNGGNVNNTPYFYARITDKDGINAAGSSVGHNLELVVDGQPSMTYNLNDYFQYDFGDYQTGTVGYSLPQLAEGEHRLTFRAWDVLNNSSLAELRFNVVRRLQPQCFSVDCTRNPATTATSFVINHDRTGSSMDVQLEIFDASGRLLWRKSETGLATDNTYTINWDLTTDSGSRLPTGVYLYRVLVSSDGSRQASKAQKLIILGGR